MTLRAIIAEDEPTLRSQLKAKLSILWPELAIVAEVGDGEAALQAIDAHRPALAFLDIQMPEMTGLEVARSIAANPEINCHVVFVTAFDQFAVDAFQAGAADYLLKPFSDDRLALAVQRLKERLALQPSLPQDLQAILKRMSAQLTPQSYPLRWIKASIGGHLRLIPIDEVLFFQSGEKYTTVATRELDALIGTPIKALLESLAPSQFWQIHRSAIVNAGAIEGVTRDIHGQAAVRIRGRKRDSECEPAVLASVQADVTPPMKTPGCESGADLVGKCRRQMTLRRRCRFWNRGWTKNVVCPRLSRLSRVISSITTD